METEGKTDTTSLYYKNTQCFVCDILHTVIIQQIINKLKNNFLFLTVLTLARLKLILNLKQVLTSKRKIISLI